MMTREEALARIKMNPKMVPAGQDPEAFISAMMAADAANAPPATPPVPVSPADPAPVLAGVPIEAPPPMAPPMPKMATDFRNQAILAANQTKPLGGDLTALAPGIAPSPPLPKPPKLFSTLEDIQEMRKKSTEAIQTARNAATVPQEVKDYFEVSGRRADAELADVDKERKQQYWMSLALAGAKMAQSKSPYFTAALAEGLESGLTGFNKARAEASEKKARLQTRKEDMILKQFEMKKIAQKEAVDDLAAGATLSREDTEAAAATDAKILGDATADIKVKTAKAALDTGLQALSQMGEELKLKRMVAGAQLLSSQAAMKNAVTNAMEAELEGGIPKGTTAIYSAALASLTSRRTHADETDDPAEEMRNINRDTAALNLWLEQHGGGKMSTPVGGSGAGLVYDPVKKTTRPR